MKLNLFRKVCLTVMGVGVISSLMSVGTFATFTATATNPNNTFAAGTLKLSTSSNTSPITTASNSNLSGAANETNTSGDFGSTTACTTVAASSCGYVIQTTNVTSDGLQPGQYVKGHITLTNSGSLPAIVTLNIQQMFSSTATNPNGTGTAQTDCPNDINGTVLATSCAALGGALNITIHDDSTFAGANGACLYGSGEHTSTPNVAGSASPDANDVAVAGACDDVTSSLASGIKLAPLGAQTPTDLFGVPGTSGLGTLAVNGAGAGTPIYVSGGDTHTVSVGSGTNNVKYWAPGESHTFTIVMAFPDQGSTTATLSGGNSGNDTLTVGRDIKYEGGKVGFDLVWLATQTGSQS
ncbi:MAG TPA: TasA family protein [Chloroflexota bacterium]|nr:TasA family protein [Chloroflexota bacterium]